MKRDNVDNAVLPVNRVMCHGAVRTVLHVSFDNDGWMVKGQHDLKQLNISFAGSNLATSIT